MSLSKIGIKSIFVALFFSLLSCGTAMCASDNNLEEQSFCCSESVCKDFCIDGSGTLTGYSGKQKNLEIPENVKKIAFGVFMEHDEIESVSFPESIKAIDEYAFYGCDNLAQVILPESVEKIGRLAFGGCKKLEIAYIGESVQEMGEFIFWGCENLYCVSVSDDNQFFSSVDGILYSKDKEKLLCCPEGYEADVMVDDDVTIVNAYSFFDCRKLKKVTMGKNVMYIDEGAFYGCENLQDLVFGPKVKKIRSAAFEKCINLSKIKIPETVKALGNSVFAECIGLEEIKFLNNKTEIPDDMLSKGVKTVIKGAKGSTAQKYAEKAKLKFKLI